MLSKSIAIATMFFILSLISERFITWFKLYFFKKGNTLLWIFFKWDKDYSVKTDDPVFEKEREQRILLLNIALSILIAFLIHANLFNILNQDGKTTSKLGWEEYQLKFDIDEIGSFLFELFGCIFAGLLMSLGSKFWHDTLDLLFYTKNLKEKLVDAETHKVNNLKQLDEYVETEYYELAQLCWEKNKDKINNLPNIVNSFIGFDSNLPDAKPVIILNSSLKSDGSYPTTFNADLSSGKPISVKTIVVYNYDIPEIHFGSGNNIFEQNNAQMNGTICCRVSRNNKNYFLTCAHVLTGGINKVKPPNKKGWITNPSQDDSYSNDNNGDPIGTWSYGQIDDSYDVALIEININTDSDNDIHEFESDVEHQARKAICNFLS
jgi:hypothetical protein